MKITIEFNLPDEAYQYNMYQNSEELFKALSNIAGHIRAVRKGYAEYKDPFDLAESLSNMIPYEALDKVQ